LLPFLVFYRRFHLLLVDALDHAQQISFNLCQINLLLKDILLYLPRALYDGRFEVALRPL
jgi:hypothetical protein